MNPDMGKKEPVEAVGIRKIPLSFYFCYFRKNLFRINRPFDLRLIIPCQIKRRAAICLVLCLHNASNAVHHKLSVCSLKKYDITCF